MIPFFKNRTRLGRLSLLLAILMLFFVAGCDSEDKKSGTAIFSEEETIAVVNNKKIPLSLFQSKLHFFLKKYKNMIPEERDLQKIKDVIIQQMVEEELIRQEAARKGIRIIEEDLDEAVEDAMKPYEGADYSRFLSTSTISKEEWRDRLRFHLLKKKLVQQEVIDRIPITKREIQSYIKKNKRDIIKKRAFRVRNLTLSTREEAEAVMAQLERKNKKRRPSFVRLIRKHSISPDRKNKGDLGFIQRGELPSEFENAIFALGSRQNRKTLSDIIHSQDGYHIFKFIQYRSAVRLGQLGQRKARKLIKEIFIREKQNDAYKKWIQKLLQKATISIDKAMLASEEGF